MNQTYKMFLSIATLMVGFNASAHLTGPVGGLSPRYSGTGVSSTDGGYSESTARNDALRDGKILEDNKAIRAAQQSGAVSSPKVGIGTDVMAPEKVRSSVIGILNTNPNLNKLTVAQYIENIADSKIPQPGSTQFSLANLLQSDEKIAKMAKNLLGLSPSEKLVMGSKETTAFAKIFSDYVNGNPLSKEESKFVNASLSSMKSINAKDLLKNSVLLTERVQANQEFLRGLKLTIGQDTLALRKFAESHVEPGQNFSTLKHNDLLKLIEKNVASSNASQFKDLVGKAAVFEGQINIATEATAKGGSMASNLATAMKVSPKVALAASKIGGFFSSGFGKLAVFSILTGAVAVAQATEGVKPTTDLGPAVVPSNVRSHKVLPSEVQAAN